MAQHSPKVQNTTNITKANGVMMNTKMIPLINNFQLYLLKKLEIFFES